MKKLPPWQRHHVTGRLASGALFLFLLAGSLFLLVQQLAGLYRMNEVGYGDSYVLYDVLHFHETGVIYRDLSQPPYLPAQYSPLVYMTYSFLGHPASGNPFFGPRLVALGAFLLCVAVVVSVLRVLIPVRGAWLWGVLLATSIESMAPWALQLRGDFFGIFFSLLAVRLLLSRSRYAVLLAGFCSGLALQFKITFVASLIAGCLWLAIRKRWRALSTFLAAAAITSAGLYFLFWLREPRMIAQMLALRAPIWDISGCLVLFLRAFTEPVALLALAALPAVLLRRSPRWALLLLFILTSLLFATFADFQAGGNINYFFEALFAMTALAAWGAMRLCAWARRNAGLALFLTGLIVSYLIWGEGKDIDTSRSRISPRAVLSENDQFRKVEALLRDLHIFSTVPRMALLDPEPALTEPFLLSYLQRAGKFDPAPIVERVRAAEFDIVITHDVSFPDFWRGVPTMPPDLGRSISSAYKPYCAVLGAVLHVPRNRPLDSILRLDWRQAGCVPPATPGFGSQ